MSIFSFSRVSHSTGRLVLDLVGQVLLVIAAAAGVLLIAGGCAPSPQQMQARQPVQPAQPSHSAIVSQPDTSLQGPFDVPVVVPAPQRPSAVQPQQGIGQTPRTNPR